MTRARKTFDFSRFFLYVFLSFCSTFLFFLGNNGEPFPLSLAFAMCMAGLSPLPSALALFLPCIFSLNLTVVLLYFGQAVLLILSFLADSKLRSNQPHKPRFLPFLTLGLSLALFVVFAPFEAYVLPFTYLPNNALTQKILIACACFLLATVFAVGLRALIVKFLKCKFHADETLFSTLLFTLCAVGFCRFLGINAYTGVAFFILLIVSCITTDGATLIVSFCLSLPPMLVFGVSPERFFFYGVATALFMKAGRLPATFALLAVFFGYGFADGLYALPTQTLVPTILSALLPALFFVLLPTPLVRTFEHKFAFYREKHLSRIAINRNRASIGEKLFELSSVFREIETAFQTLSAGEAEESAKEYLRGNVLSDVCSKCTRKDECLARNLKENLDRLIDVGCQKGKVSLIDVPRALADVCVNQNSILYALNHQLSEYKRYMLEHENASNGRRLLASQAQGVSEILKNLALEQSEPLVMYTERERALEIALLRVGVVCSETLIFGNEDSLTLSLITFGKADVKKIALVASDVLGVRMTISERLTLSGDKFCCILRKKPLFDASFGVSTLKKEGETVSGDTHSVIKIDERKFMVALSDGMGSGEYAQKISEKTIALLESFYKAKMPSALILSAVNKLMTFNKEESFTCVDIAVVDLDEGRVDVVKIGSPIGFILSGNAVKVLESHCLPLGILDSIRPETATYTLEENDVLVFISDGVADAFGSTADLYQALQRVPMRNPQQLTETLLESALKAYGGVAKDDMTVVAVRLFKRINDNV